MKRKHSFGMMAVVAICLCSLSVSAQQTNVEPIDSTRLQYEGYDMEFAADTMDNKEIVQVNIKEPALIFEKDTFDFGIIHRSDEVEFVEHIMCKCNSSKDVRIMKATTTNMHGRVSTSPIIPAGTKGTILCLIDKKSIALGKHIDTITIQTDSELTPEISIYLIYEVAPKIKQQERVTIPIEDKSQKGKKKTRK